jgi:hypothetical protein
LEPETIRNDSETARREGPVAREIETQTAKLPSDIFLWGAAAAILASLGLQLSRNRRMATLSNFFGQWAPTLLILGLYNKVVKVAGHDRVSP